jgi:peptidoglycan/LPS O-acetylase OafA/YrhL
MAEAGFGSDACLMDGQPHPSSGRLEELDALRGLAAVAVVLFHLTWRYDTMVPGAVGTPWGVPWGKYGVEIFFGISGFVIFMTLSRTRTAMDFVVSRFARLFPAYWAGVILTTLIIHAVGLEVLAVPAWAVGLNLTMLQGHLALPQVEGAYWSLSVELSFYAVMLLIWRLGLLERIEWVVTVWISLKWLWWLVPTMSWHIGYALIIDYIPFFAIGIFAYRVRVGERRWIGQLPFLVFAFVSVAVIDQAPMPIIFLTSMALFAALAGGHLGWLRHPALIWLGGISYPLYLLHQNIGYSLMAVLAHMGAMPMLSVAIAIIVVMALAVSVHQFVEQPALVLIRDRWRGSKKQLLTA